jgi:predicted aspartyl protease
LKVDVLGNAFVTLQVNGIMIDAVVDTGSTVCAMQPQVLEMISRVCEVPLVERRSTLRMGNGSVENSLGVAHLKFRMGEEDDVLTCDVRVAGVDIPIILGSDFLQQYNATLDYGRGMLEWDDGESMPLSGPEVVSVYKISGKETIVVPPQSEMVMPAVIQGSPSFTAGVVEPRNALCDGNVFLVRTMVNPSDDGVPLGVVGGSPRRRRRGRPPEHLEDYVLS